MLGHASAQRGVALLTILLLVVSITVVAGAMLASQKIAIRRSGLLFDQNQLLQDINAGQQLAVTMIRAESKLNDTDSLKDVWAQPIPPYDLGAHRISLNVRDESSRFNINNLYHDGAVDTVAVAVFQRLLTQLGLEPDIALAAVDWQDPDGQVYNDGGEESVVYNALSNSSQGLPNQPFVSVDELETVRGMNADAMAMLRPYLTAVPYYLPINVNTASPQVLAALMEGATVEQMQTLTKYREQQVLPSIDMLWQQPPLSALSDEQRQTLSSQLAVDSQAFMVLITATDNAQTGPARQRFATVLISKTSEGDEAANSDNNGAATINPSESTQANNNENNDEADTKKPKVVKVLSQRLWAFRPNF